MDALDGPVPPMTRALPTVTAIVATYNYAHFLGLALDSVLTQDYPSELLDVVVVDDGSTDATPQLLEEYQNRHPGRITVIRQPNAGNKAAANAGVAAARGELLAMIDADDLWPQDKTRRQVQRFLKDDTVGLVYCETQVIDENGGIVRPSYWDWLDIEPQRGEGAFAQIMGDPGNIAINSTIMLRAELAQRIFPIPLSMPFQDWWITAHAAALSRIDYVDGVRVGYRQHGDNGLLGASGARQVRGLCKTAEARRQMLIHGGGEHLNERELIAAWGAWEEFGLKSSYMAQSAYLPIVPDTAQERERAGEYVAAGLAAADQGDLLGALRGLIRALACDPRDADLRERVRDLAWAVDIADTVVSGQRPLQTPTRRVITVATVAELASEPALLRDYVAVVDDEDDITLVVFAPLGEEQGVQEFMTVVQQSGLELDQLPDVLLLTDPESSAQAELTRCAHTALTHHPWDWDQAAFRPDGFGYLKSFGMLASRSDLSAAA